MVDEPDGTDEAHIPTPKKVYVCKYCNKPFKRKDHYKIHLHIHTGIKSFFCPDCGKGEVYFCFFFVGFTLYPAKTKRNVKTFRCSLIFSSILSG